MGKQRLMNVLPLLLTLAALFYLQPSTIVNSAKPQDAAPAPKQVVPCLDEDYSLVNAQNAEQSAGGCKHGIDLPTEGKVFKLNEDAGQKQEPSTSSQVEDKVPAEALNRTLQEEETICVCTRRRRQNLQNVEANTTKKVNIGFRGEFGYELLAVLPFAYFHFLQGTLGRTVACGEHASIFYWFSQNHSHNSKCERNDFPGDDLRPFGWHRGLHYSEPPKEWFPPPLAQHFREYGKVWHDVTAGDRMVVISNKFSKEWEDGPVNFLDLSALRRMISRFVEAGFHVLYNRPGEEVDSDSKQKLESNDGNILEDHEFVRKLALEELFKGKVRLMQDILQEYPGLSYNEGQLRAMSRSRCFISVQGGNSLLSSYFGGTNIIYVRKGIELQARSYSRLYHRLSGARIVMVRTYERLDTRVDQLIREDRCASI